METIKITLAAAAGTLSTILQAIATKLANAAGTTPTVDRLDVAVSTICEKCLSGHDEATCNAKRCCMCNVWLRQKFQDSDIGCCAHCNLLELESGLNKTHNTNLICNCTKTMDDPNCALCHNNSADQCRGCLEAYDCSKCINCDIISDSVNCQNSVEVDKSQGCIGCEDISRCVNCVDCERCTNCKNCVKCIDCVDCEDSYNCYRLKGAKGANGIGLGRVKSVKVLL